jgi:hypothetical protein
VLFYPWSNGTEIEGKFEYIAKKYETTLLFVVILDIMGTVGHKRAMMQEVTDTHGPFAMGNGRSDNFCGVCLVIKLGAREGQKWQNKRFAFV